MGQKRDEDTYFGPDYGDKKSAIKVHALALNTRFFEIPEENKVRAFEFASSKKSEWPRERVDAMSDGGQYRRIRGARFYLDKASAPADRGIVEVTGAKIHWWITSEERDDIHQIAITKNLLAALYDNELYNVQIGSSGRHHYQEFGVLYEKAISRLTIVVEAEHFSKGRLEGVFPNTPRAKLLYMGTSGNELPWKRWGAEFMAQMPKPVQKLCADAASASVHTGLDAKEKLKDYLPRLQSVQFRRALNGKYLVKLNKEGGATRKLGGATRSGTGRSGRRGGSAGEATSGGEGGSTPARKVQPRAEIPTAEWIYLAKKTRAEGQLEGRAAQYVENANRILINGDFPLFREVTDFWISKYSGAPGAETVVARYVREVYELDLIAKVIQARGMKGTIHWASKWEQLVSEEALTMAVLGLVGTDLSLGTKIGGALGGANVKKAS